MNEQAKLRAELRRYAGSNFQLAGVAAAAAFTMQLTALTLASVDRLRVSLEPVTPWLLLALAGLAPFVRSIAEGRKREGDDLLRRVEIADALGRAIPQLEAEEVMLDASSLVNWLARFRPIELTPYASDAVAGSHRLVEITRESAWWSARLCRDLARWQYWLTGAFAVGCVAALYGFARRGAAAKPTVDLTELAAALLVFVFAEAFLRRGMEFQEFTHASTRTVENANRLLEKVELSETDAVLLAEDYHLARHVAPRIPGFWYRYRLARLNEAWARSGKPGSN